MVALSAAPEASTVGTALGIAGIVIFASWVLLIALLFGVLIVVTLLRGRRQRQEQSGESAGVTAAVVDPLLPARLARLRSADPRFDEQLLLEVAQAACLLMFAAQSTGDEQALRRLAAPSFWSTFLGRYIAMNARDARQERDPGTGRGARSRRHARFPVDFQAAAPELIAVELGMGQRAQVRVSFSQLRAVIAPGAHGQVAAASATSLGSMASALGAGMSGQLSSSGTGGSDLSWVSWAGRYDLDFTRPAGAARIRPRRWPVGPAVPAAEPTGQNSPPSARTAVPIGPCPGANGGWPASPRCGDEPGGRLVAVKVVRPISRPRTGSAARPSR